MIGENLKICPIIHTFSFFQSSPESHLRKKVRGLLVCVSLSQVSPVELHVVLVPLHTVELVSAQAEVTHQPQPLPDLQDKQ